MIMDKLNEFCDGTDATLNATNAIKGNVIDLGGDALDAASAVVTRDIGAGEQLYLVIQVATAFTGAGNVTFDLRSATVEALTTNNVVHLTTGALAYDSVWNTDLRKVYALPIENRYRKYLGIWQTTSGNLTGGTFDAFLVKDPNSWKPLADNVPAYA